MRLERFEIINHFTTKFKDCRYLEIGSATRECFYRINAKIKHDVEPFPKSDLPVFLMTSDEFFRNNEYILSASALRRNIYDVIFIDGLHLSEQVLKDVFNANRFLATNGYIVLHDCIPEKEEYQRREFNSFSWTGDVWKTQVWLVKQFKKQVLTIEDADCGCGIVSGKLDFKTMPLELMKLTWDDFSKQSLNCILWNDYLKTYEQV